MSDAPSIETGQRFHFGCLTVLLVLVWTAWLARRDQISFSEGNEASGTSRR